jgi:hypothetical protein
MVQRSAQFRLLSLTPGVSDPFSQGRPRVPARKGVAGFTETAQALASCLRFRSLPDTLTDKEHTMKDDVNRFEATRDEPATVAGAEEVMVADVRDGLTPAQMVEQRLVSLLKTTPLPMSRLQTVDATRRTL